MRIPSGVTDQYIYFVAVDSTDLKTRETGLSSFTVYRARNGAAAAAYTTPTVAEVSSANMPGVYSLLLDEDMTIGSGNDSEEVVLHITQASMAPVTLVFELYREKITQGNTLAVDSSGNGAADVIEWLSTAAQGAAGRPQVDLELWLGSAPNALASGRIDASVGAMAANVMTAAAADPGLTTELQNGLATAAALTTVEGKIDIIDAIVDAILVDTGTDIPALLTTIAGYLDTEIQAILADTNELQTDWADGGRLDLLLDAAASGSAPTADQNADALLDRVNGIETGFTPRQVLRLVAAVLVGKASGLGTTTAIFRDLTDAKDRVTSTVDGDGNRSSVTKDAT